MAARTIEAAEAPRFSKGDRVYVAALGNRIGIIDGAPQLLRGVWMYPVSLNPNEKSPFYPESALRVYRSPKAPEELLADHQFSRAEDFIRSIIYKKLEKPLSDNLYTFYSSRTQFLVHQFKPLIKFLSSEKQRLLLADEVGLGKTIEAGIILTEMEARLASLSRVLIVCPSMLTEKWQIEMRKRFAREFRILRATDLDEFLDRYLEYGETERLNGICSLETIRRARNVDRLRDVEPHFDLIIVDEVHHMKNPETLASELGEILSGLSDAVLFLSATPLQLGTPDLFNLLHLLAPEEFTSFELFHAYIEPNEHLNNALRRLHQPASALEEIEKLKTTRLWERFERHPYYREAVNVLATTKQLTRQQAVYVQRLLTELNTLSSIFTRTKKKDVDAEFPIREARMIRVEFTPGEMAFYKAVTEYVSKDFSMRAAGPESISFAIIMPQRQVASCIQAAKEKFEELSRRETDGSQTNDAAVDPEEEDMEWKIERDRKAALNDLLQLGRQIGQADTKLAEFIKALRLLEKEDPDAKIIVYSFFKRTLDYLHRRLQAAGFGDRVELIHGDIPHKERLRIIRKFREHKDVKILLSSEVGGEGLDFEFCNVIFNYDLPWNPMRVEQRIGRLDRFGQMHDKILIYNFSMVGTIDDAILNRLYRRINIFERYVGDLDAILGDEINQLVRDIFNIQLTEDQKIWKIEKVAENLERKKEDLELFEQESARFVGQDEYFNEEISRILQTKRFITSEEVQLMLSAFLKGNYPKTTLNPLKSGRDGILVLKTDDEFRRFVWAHLPGDDRRKDLDKKLALEGGLLVTFSNAVAVKDQSLEFLTIHHPLIRAIKNYYDENREEIVTTAALQLQAGPVHGDYFFFLYLLEKAALKTELQIVPVLVSNEGLTVHVQDEVTDWFTAELVHAKDAEKGGFEYDESHLARVLGTAADYVQMVREDEESQLQRVNNALVDNQIISRRETYAIKIRKTEDTIRKLRTKGHSDSDPIMRLYQGRVRRLEAELDEKIRELDNRRAASVSFRLVAAGLVTIQGSRGSKGASA